MSKDKMDKMDAAAFRKELQKIMPGYDWTVHKNRFKPITHLAATGIQTSGFNRVSTLQVVKRERARDAGIEYEVKSSGFGKRAPWLSNATGSTLAQALRALQDHYEHQAGKYSGHAWALQEARKTKTPPSTAEEEPTTLAHNECDGCEGECSICGRRHEPDSRYQQRQEE